MLSFISFIKQKNTNPASNSNSSSNSNGSDLFFDFLRQFAIKGGLQHIFPGDDARDTSVQFELISQVNCTTSVGKPISLTVRNTPQSRRRLRLFNNFYNSNALNSNSNFYNSNASNYNSSPSYGNYSSNYNSSPNNYNNSFY